MKTTKTSKKRQPSKAPGLNVLPVYEARITDINDNECMSDEAQKYAIPLMILQPNLNCMSFPELVRLGKWLEERGLNVEAIANHTLTTK